ncbi:HAMP domain-containing histidine kinase [Sphingomonas sp. So64.6b]|uniref:sensor histidine kinase n=1 Tax=Sphingomonas sp. So64.6b TaxID=2997354 RepID=UPI0016006046|nr:HAMP domain-containing sensor histidine kinase [Sphingomonas sp. So64.6b]QNA85215.1 HAMP domain-containing histidine kinase [Sphingomonas sp. So64.6b]
MVLRGLPDPGSMLRPDETAEMWGRARTAMVGIVVMTSVLIFIRAEFAGLVAPLLLNGWLAFMTTSVLLLSGSLAAFAVPRWRAARSARFWVRMTQLVTILFCGGIAASVWILLPAAGEPLRMLMIYLYFWFIAMVMMANGNSMSMVGCFALLVSLSAFVISYDMPYAMPLAGFLTMAGIALIAIRRLIWRTADEASAARQMSERAAEALERALAILRAERDAKTRFIASASHDLQQPIQAASLFFDTALNTPDPVARDSAAAGARSAFTSIQALIESMLDHLRLDAGAIRAKPVEIALDDVVAATALDHDAAAQAAGTRIVTVTSRIAATADPHLLRRALGNLVANAVRHAHGTRVLIGARLTAGGAMLWVIDDGRGISGVDIGTLFDDFAQGSDHGAENRGGFGLGLSSARRLAELQGGALDLDRRWTGGSAFFIGLPAARRTAKVETIHATPPADQRHSCEAA